MRIVWLSGGHVIVLNNSELLADSLIESTPINKLSIEHRDMQNNGPPKKSTS